MEMSAQSALSQSELEVDRSKMQVSKTDVAIEITNMHKWYGEFHVLRDINLKVMRGERIVVAGPSGSGKSTISRKSMKYAAKSAWCSSTSTSSRI